MPMTNAQARVIDPILTTVARGYQNNELVGTVLFPYVPVTQRGGKIVAFGKEHFRSIETARAPGSNTMRVQLGYAGDPYALEGHSLEGLVPFEHMQEANAVPGIDLGTMAVGMVQDIISLRLERAQAALATTPANYGNGNKKALSGATAKWGNDASDPIKDIADGVEAIRKKTGKKPNVLLLGAQVWAKVQYHTKVIERIKYTGRDSATPELFANLVGVEKVVIGEAINVDGKDAFYDLWGNFAVLAFTRPASLAQRGSPSFGYTYRLGGYPLVEQPYQDRNQKSWIYPVTDEVAPVIAGADAGYLLTDVV